MTGPDGSRPVPAERIETWIAADGIELVDVDSGRKLITIRPDQVSDLINQLVEAQGEALLMQVRDVRSDQ